MVLSQWSPEARVSYYVTSHLSHDLLLSLTLSAKFPFASRGQVSLNLLNPWQGVLCTPPLYLQLNAGATVGSSFTLVVPVVGQVMASHE
jgi:hypothetical protein